MYSVEYMSNYRQAFTRFNAHSTFNAPISCARLNLQDNDRFKMQWLKHMVQLSHKICSLLGRLLLLLRRQRLDLSFISLLFVAIHTSKTYKCSPMITSHMSIFAIQSTKIIQNFSEFLSFLCIVCILIEKQMSQTTSKCASVMMIVLIN